MLRKSRGAAGYPQMPVRRALVVYWVFGARRWLLAPAEVPLIACNAGIDKPTSPRQTADALLWTWIGILLG